MGNYLEVGKVGVYDNNLKVILTNYVYDFVGNKRIAIVLTRDFNNHSPNDIIFSTYLEFVPFKSDDNDENGVDVAINHNIPSDKVDDILKQLRNQDIVQDKEYYERQGFVNFRIIRLTKETTEKLKESGLL